MPFPAGSLAGFDITAGGKVLVAIPLRPGTPPAPSDSAAAPASVPQPAKGRLAVDEQARVT